MPKFYTKRWLGSDRRLCEFARPRSVVKAQRKFPKEVGFEPDLYAVDGTPPETRTLIEDKFLLRTDQLASDALDIFLATGKPDLPDALRIGWTRFLMSMVHRGPQQVAALKMKMAAGLAERLKEVERNYGSYRCPSDPLTFAEAKAKMNLSQDDRLWAILFQKVVDSEKVGNLLIKMRWSVLTITNPEHTFLTSDRPLLSSNGIEHKGSFVAIPISPTRLFLGVNTIETELKFQSMPPKLCIPRINDWTASRAERFVYGTDDRQLKFIENRLGRGRHATVTV